MRRYWKASEELMVRHCDLLVCDLKSIERYIRDEYARYSPDMTYIFYGAEAYSSRLSDDDP